MPKTYKIAVIHGDGIGYEINSSTIEVLKESLKDKHILDFVEYSGGWVDLVFSYTQRLISRHNFNRRLLFRVSKKWLRLISGLPESDSF